MTKVPADAVRRSKLLIARALESAGFLRTPGRGVDTVVAVNYHGTPAADAASLSAHFAFYTRCFESLDEQGLMDFLADRRTLSRPGLVITFDDGLRDNGEVAAPLLDRFGLVGWFLVPGAFLDSTPETQREYCLTHIRGDARFEQAGDDPACAMTWEVVRALAARGHAIGCHTWTHRTLGRGTPASVIEAEVVAAQHRLADRVGRSIETFCWVRGRVCDYSADAHAAVARAYALAFMTMGSPLRRGTNPLALHRFNVEASWPLSLVRFQTSRFMEAWFLRRRHAVEREIRRAELRPGTSGGLRS